MDGIIQDLRYGFRALIKEPGYTAVAILTLAIGIGASTAIFTVADAALFKGLPYKDPDNLFHLWEGTPQQDFPRREASWPDYQDWRSSQAFESVAAYNGGGGTLMGRGEPEMIFTPGASANFFTVLGVSPALGRSFQPGDDRPGAERVALLTHSFWKKKFAGDRNIPGKSVIISGITFTIVGVLPESFRFALRPADIWIAYRPSEMQMTRRGMHGTNVIARLRDGVSFEQAHAEMNVIARRIEQEHKDSHAGTSIIMTPLLDEMVGPVKPILMALLLAVGFVLLIACSNVAGLTLARSSARSREIAIRAALGAGRFRVIRQLMTESLLLALLGGAVGLLIAYWGVDILVALIPSEQAMSMPYLDDLDLDVRILGFTTLISVVTGIVFGLAPALQASKMNLNEVLKSGSGSLGSSGRHKLRNILVVAEMALAVVLLIGAGLMIKSFLNLLKVDPGFNPQNLLTMTVSIPRSKYREPSQVVGIYQELEKRIESLPGAAAAGIVNILPLIGGDTNRLLIEGRPVPPQGYEIEANFREISGSYFRTAGIPLMAGRYFDQRDNADSTPVIIINKSFADTFFDKTDPVGQRIYFPGNADSPIGIVGVAGDVRITGLDEEIKPVMYVPMAQSVSNSVSLLIRTRIDPNIMVNAVRAATAKLEPDAVIYNTMTMDEKIRSSEAAFIRQYPAVLIGIFAAVALILAAIGIYGLISYSVARQTHDIGVRIALGARPVHILGMQMKHGMVLVFYGVGIGIVAATGLMWLLQSLLFQVVTTDTAIYLMVITVITAVAMGACFIPALRATRVDPLAALRTD